MKLKQPKLFNWARVENFKYIFNCGEKRSTEKFKINTLKKFNLHLGVSENPDANEYETPSFRATSKDKKRNAEVAKPNDKCILHYSAIEPSIFDIDQGQSSRYKKKKAFTPEKMSNKLRRLIYSNLEFIPHRRNPSYVLRTRNVIKTLPNKFKLTIRKFVNSAHKNSYLRFDEQIVGNQGSKFKLGI